MKCISFLLSSSLITFFEHLILSNCFICRYHVKTQLMIMINGLWSWCLLSQRAQSLAMGTFPFVVCLFTSSLFSSSKSLMIFSKPNFMAASVLRLISKTSQRVLLFFLRENRELVSLLLVSALDSELNETIAWLLVELLLVHCFSKRDLLIRL